MGCDVTMTAQQGDHQSEVGLDVIVDERRQLLNLAYRLLGSVTEAEDVLQEAYARWYALSDSDRAEIANPGAWLTTVASRICLDQLRSARVRRERYVGEWVPEPLPANTEWLTGAAGDSVTDPADRVTLDESVSMAFLVVLESMTPAERVSFVLHDVFRYSFGEVAEIVGRSEAACRQLASSARRRIKAAEVPVTPTAQQAEVVRNFKRAWEAKDIRALIDLLDPDAVAVGDGGGRAAAALEPICGSTEIVRVLLEITAKVPGLTLVESLVNGQPGLLAQHHGTTVTVMAFDVTGGRIRHVWSVRNPDKLRPWAGR
jgi:RNA polymerase sigma-70 factor (ECF subfamily)